MPSLVVGHVATEPYECGHTQHTLCLIGFLHDQLQIPDGVIGNAERKRLDVVDRAVVGGQRTTAEGASKVLPLKQFEQVIDTDILLRAAAFCRQLWALVSIVFLQGSSVL